MNAEYLISGGSIILQSTMMVPNKFFNIQLTLQEKCFMKVGDSDIPP